jgi:peroxiredoxin
MMFRRAGARLSRTIVPWSIVALLVVLASASVGCASVLGWANPSTSAPVRQGSVLPLGTQVDFKAREVLTKKTVTLSQFEGSPILLSFVNYGCDQATSKVVSRQLRVIKRLYEQRGDFASVSIFCGCCPEDTLRKFARQNGFTWPWILDSDYSLMQQFGDYVFQYGYPTLMFIDGDLNLREVTGLTNAESLNAKIDRLLQNTWE